jgi:hypothetical protein
MFLFASDVPVNKGRFMRDLQSKEEITGVRQVIFPF